MASAGALAVHARAGSVEPARLAIRAIEATAAPAPGESVAPGPSLPLATGRQRSGAIEIAVDLASDGDAATARLSVRNVSDRPVFFESAIVGFRWRGGASGSLRWLQHGWQSWSFTGARDLDPAGEAPFPSGPWLRGLHHARGALPNDRVGWHESHLVTVAGASPEGPACLLGVLEEGVSFGVLYLRREGADVLLEAELCLDVILAPGEARNLEPVRAALGTDAVALLEDQAALHGLVAGARTARPFLSGWCSWYHFFHDVTEDDVKRNLEALTAGRDEIPVEVVQIDDGYQRAVGDWLETNPKFPAGLDALAKEIREAGFAAGLWTAPFCVVPESRAFQERPDWLMKDADGLARGLLHPEWSRDASVHTLDTTRDDVCEHLSEVFRRLVSSGFSYFKLDFLYVVAMRAVARDPGVSRAERLRRGLGAIRRGAGSDAFLLGCGCPLGAAVGIVDGMRIGPDVAPSWDVEPSTAIPGIVSAQPATKSALRSALVRSWMHRRLWINDPDCLMSRAEATQLSAAERRSLAVTVAATGGLVFLSDDVPRLAPADRALYRETRALAAEVDALGIPGRARVLHLFEGAIPEILFAGDSSGGLVALMNGGDTPAGRQVDWDSLGFAPVAGPPVPLLGCAEPTPSREVGGDAALESQVAAHDGELYRVKREIPLAVFCDFDGTFSVQDVGATLAERLMADRRPAAWARFERGEITAWDYNLEILDGLPLPEEDLERFLRTIELDPGARDLIAWCEQKKVPFRVLSDGFDYNLNRLQVLHGVRFHFDANRLRYEDGRWRIESAYPNPGCDCGTGTCKRGRIQDFVRRHPGVATVHIGNGRVSDTCGALAADLAFAKDSLAQELARRGVAYEAFDTLHDVVPRLERLLDEGGEQATD